MIGEAGEIAALGDRKKVFLDGETQRAGAADLDVEAVRGRGD